MPVRNRRVVIAGVVAAAAVAAPAAALASGPGSPSPKPTPSAGSSPAVNKTPADGLRRLDASAGISGIRLQAGLRAAKQARGNSAAAIPAFAAAAHVSDKTAQRVVHAMFNNSVNLTERVAVTALARELHISGTTARHALAQINALSGQNGVDPSSPAFKSIAHGLGVSPARLAVALDGVKRAMAGN